MNISLNIVLASTKLSAFIENMLTQGTVSQNFDLGISLNFMTKNGLLLTFFTIFYNYPSSTCHKTKTMAYINNLRHRSLLMGLNDRYWKFQA